MGPRHAQSRRSGRLTERWVTIQTGRPLDCQSSAALSAALQKFHGPYFDPIPELEESESLPLSEDISLFREHNTDSTLDMAAEDRFKAIESDVSNLKTDIGLVNDKLDKLMESVAGLVIDKNNTTNSGASHRHDETSDTPAHRNINVAGHPGVINSSATPHPPATDATVPSHAAATSHGTPPSHAGPGTSRPHTHHMIGRQITADEFIERELQRDRFDYASNGRYLYSNDISASRIIAKPYMYLYRDGLQSMKQRLDARNSMSLNEYIDAVLALLADRRAYTVADYNDIMDHVRKVTRDALERPWPAVLRWTNYVWDAVESGQMTWGDRDMIQDERIRLCLTSNSMSTSSTSYNDTKKPHSVSQVICRAYNTRMGCQHRENHGDANVWFLHSCSYCDSIGKLCQHSVRECERRVTHARNDQHGQPHRNRQFQQNNYQASQFNNQNPGPQQYAQHQFPKNGY